MLQQPPNVGDILFHGNWSPTSTVYYGQATFLVVSIDKGRYTLRLNSTSFSKRGTKARLFIKKSKSERIVTDSELASQYSDAKEMLIAELKEMSELYFEYTGVKL